MSDRSERQIAANMARNTGPSGGSTGKPGSGSVPKAPPPFEIDSTLLRLYRECPAAYAARLRGEKDTRWAAQAKLGQAAHRLAAALTLGEPEPLLAIDPEWAIDWPPIERGIREAVARIDQDKLLGVEERLEVDWERFGVDDEFPDSGHPTPPRRYRYYGTLDRLELDEDLLSVVDYKTGWAVPNQQELRRDLQMLGYAWLSLSRYPWAERVRGKQIQSRFGGQRQPEVYWTAEEVRAFGESLKLEVEAVAADRELRHRTDCECPVNTLQVNASMGLVASTNPLVVAEGVRRMEMALAQARAVLRAHSAKAGPLRVGEGGYGHWVEVRRVCSDIVAAIEVLKAEGVPLQEVLRLDLTAAKKYLHGKKAIPGLIKLMVETYTTEFGWRKDYDAETVKLGELAKLVDANLNAQLEASLPFVPELLEGGST